MFCIGARLVNALRKYSALPITYTWVLSRSTSIAHQLVLGCLLILPSLLRQDADYQRWFDEAAHPLRKQRQRPGGLEAAWAAVLGSRSAGSIMQQQLPRTLLEASVTMRWDAAAAACLGLLGALLRGAAGSRGSPAANRDGFEPDHHHHHHQHLSELEELLQGAFSRQQREVGARVATRILGFSGGLACSLPLLVARPAA